MFGVCGAAAEEEVLEFWRTILDLLRRRNVVVPVLLLSLVAAAAAYVLVPTHYVSSATAVLATPAGGGTLSEDPNRPAELTNPLLSFDANLRTTIGILALVMSTPEVLAQLGSGTGGTTVTVVDGTTVPELLGATGPFVYIKGDSTSSPSAARDIVVRAQERVRVELISRQKALNAPPITYISMIEIVPASTPIAQRGGKLEAAAGALAFVFIASVGVAYGARRILDSRRGRPAERTYVDQRS